MSGRRTSQGRSSPDAALAWVQAHGRDVDESPFWRPYVEQGDPVVRARFIIAYLDRRPTDPLRCPLRIGTMDPDVQRATVVVGWLLGDFAAPDLPPLAQPWAWVEIAAWATAHGGDGWDSYRDAAEGRRQYRTRVDAGALQIVCQPNEARLALTAILLRPVGLETIGYRLQ